MARQVNKTTEANPPLGAMHSLNTWATFMLNGSLGEKVKRRKGSHHHPLPFVLSRDNRAHCPLTTALFVWGGKTPLTFPLRG